MIFDTGIEENLIRATMGASNLHPLTVTKNGTYTPEEGYVGFNLVDVNVPKEAKLITPPTLTENKTYNASDYGADGFSSVSVNVPDRYDEGFADGEASVKAKIQSKTITENGIYYAADDGLDGFDPVNVNVPQTMEGYEFPEGTNIEEIYDVVGDDTVIDKTLDLYIKTTINSRADGGTEVIVGVYSSDGTISAPFAGGGYGPSIKNVKVDSVYINPETGAYDVTISFDGYVGPELKHTTTHQTGILGILIGFGSADHTLAVANN